MAKEKKREQKEFRYVTDPDATSRCGTYDQAVVALQLLRDEMTKAGTLGDGETGQVRLRIRMRREGFDVVVKRRTEVKPPPKPLTAAERREAEMVEAIGYHAGTGQ